MSDDGIRDATMERVTRVTRAGGCRGRGRPPGDRPAEAEAAAGRTHRDGPAWWVLFIAIIYWVPTEGWAGAAGINERAQAARGGRGACPRAPYGPSSGVRPDLAHSVVHPLGRASSTASSFHVSCIWRTCERAGVSRLPAPRAVGPGPGSSTAHSEPLGSAVS